MNIAKLFKKLRYENKLSAAQSAFLLDLQENRIFSLHNELRVSLYIGILLVIAGVGLTIKQYFAHLGDMAIISTLTLGCASALIYCFLKGPDFTKDKAPSPNLAFDYILFFGCSFYSMDIAYIETQFHILGDAWNNYLLLSVVLFFYLSYLFDNRLVLSLALSTLAAWCGFTLSLHHLSWENYYRHYAILYGLLVLSSGILLYRQEMKKHFFEIYLNFATHFIGIALLAGIAEYKIFSLYAPALLLSCIALAYYADRFRKFLYLVFAILYGYIGLSIIVLDLIDHFTSLIFSYFIVTSILLIGLIFKIARRYRGEK